MIDTTKGFGRRFAAFTSKPVYERDLLASLAGLAMPVVVTLIGLVIDANWPKLLRVVLAFSVYSTSCLLLFRAGGKRLRYWPFATSAALGAIVSVSVNRGFGLIPAEAYPRTLAVSVAASAVFLGGAHYLGIRFWRRLVEVVGARSLAAAASVDPQRTKDTLKLHTGSPAEETTDEKRDPPGARVAGRNGRRRE